MLKRVNKGRYFPRFKHLFSYWYVNYHLIVYKRRLQYLVEYSFVKFNKEIYCIALLLNHNPSEIIVYNCDMRYDPYPCKNFMSIGKE